MLSSQWVLEQQREMDPVCCISMDSEHRECVKGFECKMASGPEGLPCASLESDLLGQPARPLSCQTVTGTVHVPPGSTHVPMIAILFLQRA